jgi:hypothetical protein
VRDEGSGWWALRVVLANPPQRSFHLPLTVTASVVHPSLFSPLDVSIALCSGSLQLHACSHATTWARAGGRRRSAACTARGDVPRRRRRIRQGASLGP